MKLPHVKPVTIWEHSSVAVLPSVGVRRHQVFLTDRPNVRTLTKPVTQPTVGPPVYDARCDDSPNVISNALSFLVVILLCLAALLV